MTGELSLTNISFLSQAAPLTPVLCFTDTEPSAVLVLVSPYSVESLEYLRRHAATVSQELPLLVVYNYKYAMLLTSFFMPRAAIIDTSMRARG